MTQIQMPEGTILAYTVYHETTWWRQLCEHNRPNGGRPCVQISASAGKSAGCKWEFGVVEYDLSKRALQLEIFDEGWEAFARMAPFFTALASGEIETLTDVRELLDRLGAVDQTERIAP